MFCGTVNQSPLRLSDFIPPNWVSPTLVNSVYFICKTRAEVLIPRFCDLHILHWIGAWLIIDNRLLPRDKLKETDIWTFPNNIPAAFVCKHWLFVAVRPELLFPLCVAFGTWCRNDAELFASPLYHSFFFLFSVYALHYSPPAPPPPESHSGCSEASYAWPSWTPEIGWVPLL